MRKKLSFEQYSQSKRSKKQSLSIQKKSVHDGVNQLFNLMNDNFGPEDGKKSLKNIMHVLNQNNLPEDIPCRDNQKFIIETFILSAMTVGHSPEVLYIGGVPGIGKTICVKNIIQKFQKNEKYMSQYKPKFIYQNAMKIKQPKDIFKSILFHMQGIKLDGEKAMYVLNDYFQKGFSKQIKTPASTPKILVLDQMDYLVTRENEVIYTIVQWIRNKKSHLAIIGISNTIDLPETFSTKIQSRFGNKRIIFPQYTIQQIGLILDSRLKDCQGVFCKQAVEYICKKIGGQLTDIRKCLYILRESVNKELAGIKYQQKSSKTIVRDVPLYIVKQVVQQMFSDSFLDTYSLFPQAYRIVLVFIAKYFREQKQPLAYSQLQNILGNSVIKSVNQLRSILFDLKDLGLIRIRYMTLKYDNRVNKSFPIAKNVQQQFINLLIQVSKVFIARDAEERQTSSYKATDRLGWGLTDKN